jgi:long-chain acyl-CoA synthetase
MAHRAYPRGVPISIKYPEIPVYSFLGNSARKFPNRNATIYLGAKLTYQKLWNQTLSFAKSLQELGVEKGDRVALLLPNGPQFIIAYNATHLLGAIIVAVNPLLPVEEISRELKITESKILIILDRLLDKLPASPPEKVIVAEAAHYAPRHLRILSKLRYRDMNGPPGALRFENLTGNEKLTQFAEINPREDTAVILFTSGTTGQPKGVMLTHFGQVANALQSYYWLRGWGYSSKPQMAGWPLILCAIPFFHSYGLVVMNEALSFGCTLVLLPNPTGEEIIKTVHRHRATHAPLIPPMIKAALNHPDLQKYDLTSLLSISSGGAGIPPDMMQKLEQATGSRVYQGYGLTEFGPSVCATPVEGAPNYASVGLAYPDTEIKIVDITLGEVELPPERRGEIVVKGPQLMKGYWKNPEETAKAIREGWLYTGDIGYIDKEGYIYIIGRKLERIVADGHSVYPTEVEEVLMTHPDVEVAVAFGAPDPLRCSTDVHAIIVPSNGVKPSSEMEGELMRHCRKHLKDYEIPGSIEFRAHLPMTALGKVDRKVI